MLWYVVTQFCKWQLDTSVPSLDDSHGVDLMKLIVQDMQDILAFTSPNTCKYWVIGCYCIGLFSAIDFLKTYCKHFFFHISKQFQDADHSLCADSEVLLMIQPKKPVVPKETIDIIWLVVSNIFYCSIIYGNNHPNWLILYFSEGLKPPTSYRHVWIGCWLPTDILLAGEWTQLP